MGKINERCGGIDVGKRFLLCCVLTGAAHEDPRSQTRRFDATVSDLVGLREWLAAERITHVVMESTGSYWVPVFNILEGHFIIVLANPEEVKNRKGHKTDRKDAEHLADLLRHDPNGLIVNAELLEANGRAERDAALLMLEQVRGTKRVTAGADKGYDTAEFVAECRYLRVTPHVARNTRRRGGSAIDARTVRHAGYVVSQRRRKRIEECFGWLKDIALLRKLKHRGLFRVGWIFTFAAAAYNLVRIRNLCKPSPQTA